MRLSTQLSILPGQLQRESQMLALQTQIQISYRYERGVPKQTFGYNLQRHKTKSTKRVVRLHDTDTAALTTRQF